MKDRIVQLLLICIDKLGFISSGNDCEVIWDYATKRIAFSCGLWITFLTVIVIFSTSLFIDLTTNSYSTWFQRSGSILVVVSALVSTNARATWEDRLMFRQFINELKINVPFQEFDSNSERFYRISRIFNVLSIWFLVIGTIVWGYGDLLVN